MLFTAVILNQQTRSPLNPLVSSMNAAGKMELWFVHGLFCLREREAMFVIFGPIATKEVLHL